jgi:hypothetical protein
LRARIPAFVRNKTGGKSKSGNAGKESAGGKSKGNANGKHYYHGGPRVSAAADSFSSLLVAFQAVQRRSRARRRRRRSGRGTHE